MIWESSGERKSEAKAQAHLQDPVSQHTSFFALYRTMTVSCGGKNLGSHRIMGSYLVLDTCFLLQTKLALIRRYPSIYPTSRKRELHVDANGQ